MRSTFVLLACLVLLSAVGAQSTFVMPPGYAAQDGGNYFYYMTWYGSTPYTPTHVQMVWDTAKVPIPAGQIRGLAFRRSGYIGNMNYAATGTYSIDMSVGPNDSTTISATYGSNHGANQINVFSGKVNFPDEARPGSGLASFNIKIPFSKPFVYAQAMGKGLVVDVTCSTYTITSTAGSGSWYMDQVSPDTGKHTSNYVNSKCKFSNGKYNNSLGYSSTNLVVGGYWYVSYSSILPNAPGVVSIGATGNGGTWLGLSLPIDLTPLGATGCFWGSSIMLMVTGLTTSASGSCRVPNQTIPNDPALAGTSFYTQPAWVDLQANAAGIVTGWSSKWTIGSGAMPPCSYVYKYRDTTPPATSGYLRKGYAPVTEFAY